MMKNVFKGDVSGYRYISDVNNVLIINDELGDLKSYPVFL